MRESKIIKNEDGTYNFYDFSEFGHIFRITKDEIHTLIFKSTELLRQDPVVRTTEGPEDHEGCD